MTAALLLVSAATLPPLRPDGERMVDPQGRAVTLKGCNLGNWLLQEFWMFAMPGVETDQYGFEETLARRFGEAKKEAVMETFRRSYVTERDWKTIRSFGFNVVRVPLNYRMFERDDKPYALRPNAWRWTDHAVREAGRHGLYVILDLHGVQGGQSREDHTGRRGQNRLWTEPENAKRAAWLWEQIARRYRKNDTVVAYDLYNEPYGGTKPQQVELFRTLYPAVRRADPDKLVFAHGHWDDFDHYGDPKANGWRHVGFQMHYYPGLFGGGPPTVNTQLRHLQRMGEVEAKQNRFNVPFLIGEFNVVFDRAGGAAMMRAHYDRYAEYGWMATLWSYKVASAEGGHGAASWGMVTNAKPSRRIDPERSSYADLLAWAKGFADEELAVNEPLRKALTAKQAPPLPTLPTPITSAPQGELPGWTAQDVGETLRGGLEGDATELKLYGGGADIWGRADGFRFLYQEAKGDFTLKTEVQSLLDTGPYAKAGLMARASDAPDAPFFFLTVFPSGELQLARRDPGGEAAGVASATDYAFGRKLRLERRGDLLTASYETGRGEWKTLGTAAWTAPALVGPVALSHSPQELTVATYKGLTLKK